MTIRKCFFFSTVLILCAQHLPAQSVKWSVPPKYDAVEQVTEKLYKVTSGKSVGIVSAEGKVVVDTDFADKITDFSEGLAVAMKVDKNKNYRLAGIIYEDGRTLVPPGEYYLGDYAFFSEGMLPVFNKKGAYGFLDKEGSLAVDFKYSTVHPFCEGYALVGLGKSGKNGSRAGDPLDSKDPVTYVDYNGVEIPLDKSLGKIYFGTSFYKGEAVVKTKKGSFCTIGTSGEVIQLDVKPNLKFDWKYRLSEEKRPEGFAPSSVVFNGPTPFQENGKYGYMRGSRHILAPQFEEALPFEGGYAVAKLRPGAVGILKLLDAEVACSLERGSVAVSEKGKEAVAVVVRLPQEMKDDDIVVRCYGEDHNSQFTLRGDGTTKRTAQYVLPSSPHNVEVSSGGLIIYESRFEAIGPDASITVAIATTANRANEKDEQAFVVTFTNTGTQTVVLPVSVSGTGLASKKTTLTIKPGQKGRVSSVFLKVTKTEYRKVTVVYGDDTLTKSLQVKPIFD